MTSQQPSARPKPQPVGAAQLVSQLGNSVTSGPCGGRKVVAEFYVGLWPCGLAPLWFAQLAEPITLGNANVSSDLGLGELYVLVP